MRLDSFLFENGYFSSRNKAAECVKRGEVLVNGKVEKKPSKEVSDEEKIEIVSPKKFVSIGGYKLDKALSDFALDVKDLVFADIGASTGGFTDCLLQRGAKKVYAVDVGENLLDESLKKDTRVVALDKVNARNMTERTMGEKVDGAVADCSFISLKLILPAIVKILKPNGFIVALIKPQFECEGKGLTKTGLLRDEKSRLKIVEDISEFAEKLSLVTENATHAPINDGKNVEYLLKLSFTGKQMTKEQIINSIRVRT
ncbi:MAG TPA: TlyA family rRNA (cytidine-2'-O)-methyltransferase [Clostridiales bacterium]|nr:TlyA family rRNA (cytidine-2'-O)-methyltransferase [Clostridiales bacterium]